MRSGWPAALLVVAVILVSGVRSLGQYGVTWDEGLGDLFFGQRYWSYFTTLDSRYLDFRADPYPPGTVPDLSMSPFRAYPWEYFPVADTLAAGTSRLFSNHLRLVDPLDGFHLFSVILGAAFAGFLFLFMRRYGSTAAAILAVAFLYGAPRVFGDFVSNIKDFPEMVFFSATVMAAFVAIERRSSGIALAAGLLCGLALGTKANALFIPFIVAPYALWVLRDAPVAVRRRMGVALFAAGIVSVVILYASWPYLWRDPIRGFGSNLFYIATRGSGTYGSAAASAALMVLGSTPPLFLLAAAAGIVLAIRRRDPLDVLLLVWAGVAFGRLALPHAVNFDVVRHFLELFPALAMLAARGTADIVRALVAKRTTTTLNEAIVSIVVAAVSLTMMATVWRIHPFETAYWNLFAGGPRGAARWTPQAGDYWATSYRHGMRWLNTHAAPGSYLIVPIAEQTVAVAAPLRLRPDIRTTRYATPEFITRDPNRLAVALRTARTAPVYVMFVTRPEWDNETTEYCRAHLRPLAQWVVDGYPLMQIYRLAG